MRSAVLAKGFIEAYFEEFQEWLEDVQEIEGTEAEGILEELCDEDHD